MSSSSLQQLLVSNEESNSYSATRTVGETGLLGLPPSFSMLRIFSLSRLSNRDNIGPPRGGEDERGTWGRAKGGFLLL